MVKKKKKRNRERTLVVTALFLWPVVWFDFACIQTESQRELTDIFNVYLSIRYLLLCTCIQFHIQNTSRIPIIYFTIKFIISIISFFNFYFIARLSILYGPVVFCYTILLHN